MDLGLRCSVAGRCAKLPGIRLAQPTALALLVGLGGLGGSLDAQDAGLAGADFPVSEVHYAIRARMDGDPQRIEGSETLRWTNGTSESVSDLQFHLYLNAFSNNRSTHVFEGKGKLRRGHELKAGWGWTRVTAAAVAGTDLFPTLKFLAPDDGRPEDRTVFSLDLPAPVLPGETIEVMIEWESQLPRVRRRTGYKDDFVLVAQWFPKLGVYEEGRGWNAHQFHANSEFFADYGTYDVTLDLPASYRDPDGGEPRVGGSGVLVSSELKGDERLMVRFVAPSREDQRNADRVGRRARVHDFTWTADPAFEVRRETFRYSTWANEYAKDVELARRAFGPDKDLALHNVDVRLLIHPERLDQADRHIKATSAALFFYGLWFGEYPYSQITVVDPPWGGRAAGGMEYPTLFTCGTRLFTTEDMYQPESVTVHECGHQFWYGLVGNNEFEGAWLDEGFNSYTDSEVMWRVYGEERRATFYSNVPRDGERAVALPGGGAAGDPAYGTEDPGLLHRLHGRALSGERASAVLARSARLAPRVAQLRSALGQPSELLALAGRRPARYVGLEPRGPHELRHQQLLPPGRRSAHVARPRRRSRVLTRHAALRRDLALSAPLSGRLLRGLPGRLRR